MSKKEKIPVSRNKAVIFQDKYDVRQFRTYVKQPRRYFEKSLRTKEQAPAEEPAEEYLFSEEGDKEFQKTNFHRHCKGVLRLTTLSIEGKLVLYLLRNSTITQRVMSGYRFSDISYVCNKSVNLIEKIYYHLNEAMMKTTALATYVKRDGKVIPINISV